MSNLYTKKAVKMSIIINIKYVVIDNFILIMIENTLKPLYNKGFYQAQFFS
jgi:hypothetical protein